MKQSFWILIVLIAACAGNQSEQSDNSNPKSGASLIADTIIYDVIIKNTNPDDTWTDECLQNLQHDKFMDSIFSMVYDEKAIAYEYFSNEPLKIGEIQKMEAENQFSRKNIGKIQFTEKWYFNNTSSEMQKEVLSIVLGNELYTDSGEFRGYKPVFKIMLTP